MHGLAIMVIHGGEVKHKVDWTGYIQDSRNIQSKNSKQIGR